MKKNIASWNILALMIPTSQLNLKGMKSIDTRRSLLRKWLENTVPNFILIDILNTHTEKLGEFGFTVKINEFLIGNN